MATKKMVILFGDALRTPEILERSGIGDSRVLIEAGVEVLVDLPGVGAELDDHQVCYGLSDDELRCSCFS